MGSLRNIYPKIKIKNTRTDRRSLGMEETGEGLWREEISKRCPIRLDTSGKTMSSEVQPASSSTFPQHTHHTLEGMIGRNGIGGIVIEIRYADSTDSYSNTIVKMKNDWRDQYGKRQHPKTRKSTKGNRSPAGAKETDPALRTGGGSSIHTR